MGAASQLRGIVFTLSALSCAVGFGDDTPHSRPQVEFFEQHIRPLLIKRCFECHSHDKKIKGGLALDSRGGWKKGGDTGPAILPGKPNDSLLIKAVRYDDADIRMPPAGKLPDEEIALLEQWVLLGAPDPRTEANHPAANKGVDFDSARQHWAYRPLHPVAIPNVRDAAWPRDDLDHFVLAALDEHGLQPSPDADRAVWLRRVSLDLTGLPPTSHDVETFLADPSPDPYPAVLDRLLASRAFGERWARAWLDLVGYADQIGSANNVPAEHAWRYRDYVIESFCGDKPYDVMIREQLAGDLLTATSIEERKAQLTATGFLVLGNVNIVESDKLVMRMDLVDQQVEKIGKTFLGMTLNCVRCHDHKFDPVTLRDYYGLAGILASTESTYKAERGVWSSVTKLPLPETLEEFSRREAALRAHERRIATLQQEQAAQEARLKEIQAALPNAPETAAQESDAAKTRAALEKELGEVQGRLRDVEQRLRHANYLKPDGPVAFGVKDGPEIADARIQIRGNPHVLGETVPRGFIKIATHGPAPEVSREESGRRELAAWLTGPASALTARTAVNRVWQKLFGRGLVEPVDYFGLRSEPPTHPELLDHLSWQFIEDGWSFKRLIRRIALSRTYRQASLLTDAGRAALDVDPDNRWLWRMSPRRLEAEMLRDSVLLVSGELQPIAGGPALAPEFPENVGGLDPKDVNPISFSLRRFRDDQSRIRTIYLPVVRSSEQRGPADVLNFFDFPQPAQLTGSRPTTAVSSQALFLLNGPLFKDAARQLAIRILGDASSIDDHARLASLWMSVWNRPIRPDEEESARALLAAASADEGQEAAWTQLIHALLISNEFLFRL